MKAFRAVGSYDASRMNYRSMTQVFNVQVAAEDENAAREQVLSNLGSRHKLKRYDIKIDEIVQLTGDEVTDMIVKHKIGEM